MAKKRIAADVDLCGNSVENVKNVTASGTVKANTLDGKSNYVDCGVLSKDGWYRFASSPQLSGQTDAIFSVGHFYNNNIAENYLIAVSISYEGFATISQLSGSNAYGLHQIISKVRVVWSISGYHIDFQVSKSVGAGNKFFISQFGGIFDVFEATAAPEPTSSDKVTELSLVNGMTCSEGFKGNVVGDVTGNVVGNVTGELTGTLGGRVAALPSYNSGDLGLTTSVTDDEYIQALLKKLVSEHSNLLGMTLIGKTVPNSQRNVILYTYTSTLNGMPKYCSGMMCDGYAGGVYSFWINNGVFVGKTIVGSNGDLIGARTDHNGNTIATTYATKSEVNNKVTKNNPDGVQAYEGNLKFGTGSVAGSVNPLDMVLIPECGANRFAFIPPECITIEYSRDAGATWLDYGASDRLKVRLVSNYHSECIALGKSSTDNPATSDCRLRVTIKTQSDITKMYSTIRKFAMRIATVSQPNCWCTIKARTMSNIEADADVWITAADKAIISGDSGNNVINVNPLGTYSWNKANYGEIQFIFGSDANAGDREGLRIYNIFAYGENAWIYPSEMAKTGHLYSYDYAQNATFPNGVTAKSFTGNLVGRANNALMDADNNNISATYLKKTDAESTYATKTTANGLQSQISSMVAKTQKLSSDGSTYSGKAVNDGEGNNISETYAKKSDLSKYVTGEDYSNHLQAADKKYATKDELQEGTYTEGDGIEISTDKVISVKKDSSSESFLSVGADGVKVSGVQTAIDNAKIAVIGKQGNNSAMNTVFGAKKYTDEKVQAVSSDVTSLEGRVSTNETDISNLRSSLNEAITDFQQDYDRLGEEVGDIRNDYTALDGKIDTTKSELIGNSSATTTSGATIYDTRRYAASLFDNLGNTYTTKNELGALKGTVDSHNEGLNKCVQDISALNTRTTDVEDKTSKLTADGSEFKGKVYYDRHGDDICETYLRKDDLTEGDGIELSDTYEISLALADANKGDQTEGYLVFEQGKLATRGIDDAIADAVDEAKTDLSSSFATKSQYNSLNSQVQAQQTHISTLINERVSVLGGRTGAYTGPTSGTHIWGFVSSGSVNLQSSGVTSGTRLTVATAVSSVTIKRSDGGTIFNSGSGGVTSIIVPGYSFAECIYMNGLWIVKI